MRLASPGPGFAVALLATAAGCEKEPYAILKVDDPHGIASTAVEVRAGKTLDNLKTAETPSAGLPMEVTITTAANQTGLVVWAEAYDAAGLVLGRGRTVLDTRKKRRSTFVVDLQFVCSTAINSGEPCELAEGADRGVCSGDGCALARCGDGVANGNEACDDGVGSADCDPDCTVPVCGDGITNTLAGEVCDDGGLSTTCDYDCTRVICGDGVINPLAGEECDDDNDSITDTCPSGASGTCQLAECSDGFVAVFEDCDDNNGIDTDACPDGPLGTCEHARCGDGIVRADVGPLDPLYEECDDANVDETDACTVDCHPPSCVDGATNGAETGPDCGGAQCVQCVSGFPCEVGSDCVVGACVSEICGTITWSRSPTGNPWPLREFAEMELHEARGTIVMYGGRSVGMTPAPSLGDTWESPRGTLWTEIVDPSAPGARHEMGMAYDVANGRIVIAGGRSTDSGGTTTGVSSTWEYGDWGVACTAGEPCWLEIAGAAGPSGRARLAYDRGRDVLVLFHTNDASVYELENDVWQEKCTGAPCIDTRPTGRHGAVFEYSSKLGASMVWGGIVTDCPAPCEELWLWDGASWTMELVAGPGAVYFASAHHPVWNRLVMFGRENDDSRTWMFSDWGPELCVTSDFCWVHVLATVNPPPQVLGAMAYSSEFDQLVLFGGSSSTACGVTGCPDSWMLRAE